MASLNAKTATLNSKVFSISKDLFVNFITSFLIKGVNSDIKLSIKRLSLLDLISFIVEIIELSLKVSLFFLKDKVPYLHIAASFPKFH